MPFNFFCSWTNFKEKKLNKKFAEKLLLSGSESGHIEKVGIVSGQKAYEYATLQFTVVLV
jgi:hypothetical protein